MPDKKPKPKEIEPEIAKPPKQKHFGTLANTMRKAHNSKRMDAVRSYRDQGKDE